MTQFIVSQQERQETKKERKVTMYREKVYSCKLVGFKRKANTLVRIKKKVRSLIPSLLIKLSQVLSQWMQAKFEMNHVKFSCYYFYSFVLVLLVCSTIIFFCKYYILSRFHSAQQFVSERLLQQQLSCLEGCTLVTICEYFDNLHENQFLECHKA